MNRLKNKKGQGLIEYLIIVALMAVATMAIMRVMSQTVSVKFAQVTAALQGKSTNVTLQADEIKATDIKRKDMSDFFRGTKSNGRGENEE